MLLYTSSYDGRSFVLEDEGDDWSVRTERSYDDQTTDVFPDRDGNVLVAHRTHGVHKYAPHKAWEYTDVEGSIRGLTTDVYGNYYTGSWTAGQGFHKLVERGGGVERDWVYRWDDDTGMITAKPDRRGRLALALKNNEVHVVEERDGTPELVWKWSPGTGEIMREVLWGVRGDLYVGSEDRNLYRLSPSGELLDSVDLGRAIFGASLTRQNDIYAATSEGIAFVTQGASGLAHQWTYEHLEAGSPQLVHQVAAHPDGDHIYSCCYDEATVHKIDPNGRDREPIWTFDGHTDHVREVRLPTEYAGIHPEVYGYFADSETWDDPGDWRALRDGGAIRTGDGVRLGYDESRPPLDVQLEYYLPCTDDPGPSGVETTSGILGDPAYEFQFGSIEVEHSLPSSERTFFAWVEPYEASGEIVKTFPDFDASLHLDGDLVLSVDGESVAAGIETDEFASVGYTVGEDRARLYVDGRPRGSVSIGGDFGTVAGDRIGSGYHGKLCHAVATPAPQGAAWFERMHGVTTGGLSTYPLRS